MMKKKISIFELRFKIWLSLLDTATQFALAGFKFKRYPPKESLKKLYQNWKRDSQEHMRGDLEIIKKLYA